MENFAGFQASIALQVLMKASRFHIGGTDYGTSSALQDVGNVYGSGNQSLCLDGLGAEELLSLVRDASALLDKKGVKKEQLSGRAPERLRISADYRIFIIDRGNVEILLQPLVKTLFIFFLKHTEGVNFKDMVVHKEELMGIYGKISGRGDIASMKHSIDHLIDLASNNLNTQRYSLLRSLSGYFDGNIVESYCITGRKGQKKRIPLERTLITWEQ